MKPKKNFRSQSALEYLMTYGWTLIVIIIIVSILILFITPIQNTINCTSFDKFLVKDAKVDSEKIQLAIQNSTGSMVDGFQVYESEVYPTDYSPPLFQINVGDATVGSTTNTALSNDYVITFVENYDSPLPAKGEKKVIIPWPIHGFAGQEFGANGCQFFAEAVGKSFDVTITVYHRSRFGNLPRKETAKCTGIIQAPSETFFPLEVWGC